MKSEKMEVDPEVEPEENELDADESEEIEDGSDDIDEDDEIASDSDDSDPKAPRRKKHKPFVPPPPRELPARTTRGQRIGNLQAVNDDQADEEFWNQEFFAEEERDEIYETESEPEDRFDADFMESEDEEDEDDMDAEEQAKLREPKKKTLKPPGYKQQQQAKAKPEPKIDQESDVPAIKKVRRSSAELAAAAVPAERTMGVRDSTRIKVAEAAEERKLQEALKPRRISRPIVHRQLTQADLLAEAARTEIENTRSLQYLVALEEETKKKAHVKKGKYVGPMIRLKSFKKVIVPPGTRTESRDPANADGGGANLVEKATTEQHCNWNKNEDKSTLNTATATEAAAGVVEEEQTTLEVANMQTPEYLRPQKAPPVPKKALCAITGEPAKYRDPSTGLGYVDMNAYKELQRRKQQASITAQQQQVMVLQQQRQVIGMPGGGQQHQQQHVYGSV